MENVNITLKVLVVSSSHGWNIITIFMWRALGKKENVYCTITSKLVPKCGEWFFIYADA